MKGSLYDDRLSRLQPANDLRLVVDCDASIHLALLELRLRTANENYTLSFRLLKSTSGYGNCLFAEFGWKLYVGEHVGLEA